MKEISKIWVGVDPGGADNYGVAIIQGRRCQTRRLNSTQEAIEWVSEVMRDDVPAGVGVDSPLWWSAGPASLRKADERIRCKTTGVTHSTAQAINSLRGSVLAQGMMFVDLIRRRCPNVPVTESHPKAVLKAMTRESWEGLFASIETSIHLDSEPDHERDAIIAALCAREGFEKRWTCDLSQVRDSNEQDPSQHWLGPVHYFWPIHLNTDL